MTWLLLATTMTSSISSWKLLLLAHLSRTLEISITSLGWKFFPPNLACFLLNINISVISRPKQTWLVLKSVLRQCHHLNLSNLMMVLLQLMPLSFTKLLRLFGTYLLLDWMCHSLLTSWLVLCMPLPRLTSLQPSVFCAIWRRRCTTAYFSSAINISMSLHSQMPIGPATEMIAHQPLPTLFIWVATQSLGVPRSKKRLPTRPPKWSIDL